MTDRQLLEAFLARRDQAAELAFGALVAQHGPMVWNVCRSVLMDSHAAEDAFQATFLILVRKASSIHRRETLGPWLHGVARRVAVRAKTNMARQRKRECHAEETTAAAVSPHPDQEEIHALHQEIDRLPEKYRAVVVLCHLEGRTHTEAARLLQCPPGTISVRASRARNLLRDRLARRGVTPSTVFLSTPLDYSSAFAAIPPGLADATIKAAIDVAAGKAMAAGAVPAAVTQLIDGVLRTMRSTNLTIVAASVLTAGIVSSTIALYAMGKHAPSPSAFMPAGMPIHLASLPQDKTQPAAPDQPKDAALRARLQTMNNLKMIGLAMHGFGNGMKEPRFPPAALEQNGKPLLSWRVAILPHLDQKALYDQFHLDEPWDSPHNKTLLDQMPDVYAPAVRTNEPKGSTYYQVFVGPKALFEDDLGPKLKDIDDGTSATLLVVEAGSSVPWTKPEDLEYDETKPVPKLGHQVEDGFFAALADASARFFQKTIPDKALRSLITSRGGEPITPDQF
jgi:RNA polymerase sigma factor (sigma-70 family)